MRFSRIIPLTSLAIVATVLGIGALHDAPLGMEFTALPQDSDIPEVNLGLGDATLRARLIDPDGQPVPDAGVTTIQGGRPIWTWTGRDGSFELGDLQPGPLNLRVVALGFEASQFDAAITGHMDPDVVEEFVLDRRIGAPPDPPALELGDLDGFVHFGAFATPDRGYELLLQPLSAPTDPEGGFPRRTRVAPDGTFHVDLLHAGHYRVILLSPDDRGAHGPDLLQTKLGDPRTMTHETNGDTPRLTLVATMGAVSGRVIKTPQVEPALLAASEEPQAATPIRGALIRIERLLGDPENGSAPSTSDAQPDPVTFRATQSEQDGSFTLRDLPPGRYRLTLVAGRDRRTMDVTIPTGEVVRIDIDLAAR